MDSRQHCPPLNILFFHITGEHDCLVLQFYDLGSDLRFK